MDTLFQQVGKKLAQLRKKRRLTQQELAERAGLSVVYLSYLETGRKKKGTLGTFDKLMRSLDLPLADLFRFDTEKKLEPLDSISLKGLDSRERRTVKQMVATLKAKKGR